MGRFFRTLLVAIVALMLGACMEALQEVRTPTARPAVPPINTTERSPATPSIASDSPLGAQATPTSFVDRAAPVPPVLTQVVVSVLPTQSYAQRWRDEQLNRQVLPVPQIFTTTNSELWWYDPVNQQHVVLGSFAGSFDVQATFVRRTDQAEALEVPYQVNVRYGLTALSPAILARITAAGYGEWIETYVLKTSAVSAP